MKAVSLDDMGDGSVDLFNKNLCGAADIPVENVPDSPLPILQGNDIFHRIIPKRVKELADSYDTVLIPDHGMMAGLNPEIVDAEVVPIVHDLDKLHKKNGNFIERFNIKESVRWLGRASKIIAISEQTRQEILDETSVPSEKVSVVKQGFDSSRIHRDPADPTSEGVEDSYVLYIGALMERKKTGFLLEVLNCLPDEYSLVIAGKSYDEENRQALVSKAEEMGVDDRIIFPGFVSLEELRRLYSNAAVYLHPAVYEGYGRTPVEAAMTGTPPIVYSGLPCAEDLESVAGTYDSFDAGEVAELVLSFAGKTVDYEARTWKDAAKDLKQVIEK